MRKIISSLLVIMLTSVFTISITRAYFTDSATSTGNRISAGTLNLDLDGQNANVVKFPASSIEPEQTLRGTWTVRNTGTLAGFLDLENITKSSDENLCTDPETVAGDTTCVDPGAGELLTLLNVHLFVDANNNGTYDAGTDTEIFNGKAADMANAYNQNIPLAAGETKYISMVINWPTSANENLGQSDSFNFGMTFELAQTQGQ